MISLLIIALLFLGIFVSAINSAETRRMPSDTMTLRLANAKRRPVTFSHGDHSKNIACVVCHHKDKEPEKPDKCVTCHLLGDLKDNAIPINDAFHNMCQGCHKENATKGVNTPAKCNDCHKK